MSLGQGQVGVGMDGSSLSKVKLGQDHIKLVGLGSVKADLAQTHILLS